VDFNPASDKKSRCTVAKWTLILQATKKAAARWPGLAFLPLLNLTERDRQFTIVLHPKFQKKDFLNLPLADRRKTTMTPR